MSVRATASIAFSPDPNRATECLAAGTHGVLLGLLNGRVSTTPLAEVVRRKKPIDPALLQLAAVLAK